jgi:hypothetical protein
MDRQTGNDIAISIFNRIQKEDKDDGLIGTNESGTEYSITYSWRNPMKFSVTKIRYWNNKNYDYILRTRPFYPSHGEFEVNCTNYRAKKIFNLLKEKMVCV